MCFLARGEQSTSYNKRKLFTVIATKTILNAVKIPYVFSCER